MPPLPKNATEKQKAKWKALVERKFGPEFKKLPDLKAADAPEPEVRKRETDLISEKLALRDSRLAPPSVSVEEGVRFEGARQRPFPSRRERLYFRILVRRRPPPSRRASTRARTFARTSHRFQLAHLRLDAELILLELSTNARLAIDVRAATGVPLILQRAIHRLLVLPQRHFPSLGDVLGKIHHMSLFASTAARSSDSSRSVFVLNASNANSKIASVGGASRGVARRASPSSAIARLSVSHLSRQPRARLPVPLARVSQGSLSTELSLAARAASDSARRSSVRAQASPSATPRRDVTPPPSPSPPTDSRAELQGARRGLEWRCESIDPRSAVASHPRSLNRQSTTTRGHRSAGALDFRLGERRASPSDTVRAPPRACLRVRRRASKETKARDIGDTATRARTLLFFSSCARSSADAQPRRIRDAGRRGPPPRPGASHATLSNGHTSRCLYHRTDAHLGAASVGTRSRLEAYTARLGVEPSYTASPLAPEAGERAVGHAVVASRRWNGMSRSATNPHGPPFSRWFGRVASEEGFSARPRPAPRRRTSRTSRVRNGHVSRASRSRRGTEEAHAVSLNSRRVARTPRRD